MLLLGTVGSAAGAGGRDIATGDGWRLLDGARIAQFMLGANSATDGSDAHGTYSFVRDGVGFVGSITCLRAQGAYAVVGGQIDETNIPGAIGFLLWLHDGGTPAGGQPGPDEVSFTLVSPGDPAWPDGIADVPTTCPSIALPDGVEWRAVEGNLTIIDR
jgi:hypothetical protein